VDDYRPKVFGLVGSNFFKLGDRDQALKYTELALNECKRSGDAEGVRVYTENLRVLSAAIFAESADQESVRLRRIRSAIARAQDLSDSARFDLSSSVLDEVLNDIGADKNAAAEYRGKVYGLLGLNSYRLGQIESARSYTEKALEECDTTSDVEGIRVYTANLRTICAALEQKPQSPE
jgi:tetratricopeptide (TPR) repeat protein